MQPSGNRISKMSSRRRRDVFEYAKCHRVVFEYERCHRVVCEYSPLPHRPPTDPPTHPPPAPFLPPNPHNPRYTNVHDQPILLICFVQGISRLPGNMADYPKHVAGNGNETLDNNVSQNVMEHLRSVFLALSRKKDRWINSKLLKSICVLNCEILKCPDCFSLSKMQFRMSCWRTSARKINSGLLSSYPPCKVNMTDSISTMGNTYTNTTPEPFYETKSRRYYRTKALKNIQVNTISYVLDERTQP
jgi:hypothetical protein